MSELMRLRVFGGWAVLGNKFYDVDPVVAADFDGFIGNWDEGFTEDTLWIRECILTKAGYKLLACNCFTIDIGWYPDSRVDGQYYAKLAWCSSEELRYVDQFESKDRFAIRDKIEFWMEDVKIRYDYYKSLPAGNFT